MVTVTRNELVKAIGRGNYPRRHFRYFQIAPQNIRVFFRGEGRAALADLYGEGRNMQRVHDPVSVAAAGQSGIGDQRISGESRDFLTQPAAFRKDLGICTIFAVDNGAGFMVADGGCKRQFQGIEGQVPGLRGAQGCGASVFLAGGIRTTFQCTPASRKIPVQIHSQGVGFPAEGIIFHGLLCIAFPFVLAVDWVLQTGQTLALAEDDAVWVRHGKKMKTEFF